MRPNHRGLLSGGGYKQNPSKSFDMDFMLPPDIASIDSDISKTISDLLFRQTQRNDTISYAQLRWRFQ